MEAELSALDERIRQLIALAERLRADNIDLRQQLAAVQGENRQLRDKVSNARERLEGLLTRIPQDAE